MGENGKCARRENRKALSDVKSLGNDRSLEYVQHRVVGFKYKKTATLKFHFGGIK
jgi:hypothetical protein